jgi:hypothetical protein
VDLPRGFHSGGAGPHANAWRFRSIIGESSGVTCGLRICLRPAGLRG